MTIPTYDKPIACDFGSGARLWIGMQIAHAVIVASEPEPRAKTVVGLTPASMRAFAAALIEAAEELERKK